MTEEQLLQNAGEMTRLALDKILDPEYHILNELEELSDKLVKLLKFTCTTKFSELSERMQWTMKDQLRCMMDYADCLRKRLSIWGKSDAELNDNMNCKIG